jgi:hypothetical protein
VPSATASSRRPFTVLAATSGHTGSAAAAGFHQRPWAEVVLLYPKQLVSPRQPQQLLCWGDNLSLAQASLDVAAARRPRAGAAAERVEIAGPYPQTFHVRRIADLAGRGEHQPPVGGVRKRDGGQGLFATAAGTPPGAGGIVATTHPAKFDTIVEPLIAGRFPCRLASVGLPRPDVDLAPTIDALREQFVRIVAR